MQQFRVSLAPDQLWQAINPWTFNLGGGQLGLVNISLGATPRPETEGAILDQVGSYGRQLGRIGDALEVILARWQHDPLSREDEDAIALLRGQLAEIRAIKARD